MTEPVGQAVIADKHEDTVRQAPEKSNKQPQRAERSYKTYQVGYGEYKCYMDYRCITDYNSPQHSLQQSAYTTDCGIRAVGDRYCVALGSAYGSSIGDRYTLILSTGKKIKCILSDQKADCDTNATNTADMNGAVAEFIVDTPALDPEARQMGDISYCDGFGGKIVDIRKELNN